MNTTLLENIEFIQKTGSLREGSTRRTIEPVFWEVSYSTKSRKWNSTPVENVRQIQLFLQNKPNFSSFFTQKPRLHKKTKPIQTQYKANSKPFLGHYQGDKANSNPIQNLSQVYPREVAFLAHSRGMVAYFAFLSGTQFQTAFPALTSTYPIAILVFVKISQMYNHVKIGKRIIQ